ncbi:MAG: hypothetical protein Q9227_006707 [Pyrenula ochraceoflavens]
MRQTAARLAEVLRPTLPRRSGGLDPKHGKYMGPWGDFGHIQLNSRGGRPQKGITSYSLSPNRQNPLAGTLHAAIFNVYRRTKNQIWYWLPPMVGAYLIMDWAEKRNQYLNSKAGRMEEFYRLQAQGGDED